jgi:hypothetical protein
MTPDRTSSESDAWVSMAHEALTRARHVVAAQAELLAEQMDSGVLPGFAGPDALRLLAMILQQD